MNAGLVLFITAFGLAVANPALAECNIVPNGTTILAPETRPAGTVIYNSDYDVLQECRDDGSWWALGLIGADLPHVPTGCPDVGDVCSDGTVYVGLSPDGGVPMYAIPADPSFGLPWGGPEDQHLGLTSWYTGRGNSAALAALGTMVAPAAYYCDTLTDHGHEDWYLPAVSELLLLGELTGTAALDGEYWSSTEVPYDPEDVNTLNRALTVHMPGNNIDWYRGKPDYRGVRCVRRAASPVDPCTGTPAVGTLCADDTIYAGLSPDGDRPMYITQDLAPGLYRWGPSGANTAMTDCTSSGPGLQATCTTGYDNTVFLAGLGASYEAATYCHNLYVHGHDDWYLPSQNELDVLYNNLGPHPYYGFGDWHWSSSESGANNAWDENFSNGQQAASGKQDQDHVRCVRRD